MSLTAEISERVQPFLAPVSAAAPAGSSPRSDPRYERVVAEVGKLDALSGGAPDWRLVIEQGGDLLRTAGKDLLTAAQVAYGMAVVEGPAGLAVGAALLAGLIDEHWEGLFPERTRLRGRANSVAWFVERAARLLEDAAAAGDGDRAAAEAVEVAVRRLADVVGARFGADAPAMRPLLTAVERLAAATIEAAPAPAEAAALAAEPTVPGASAAAPAPVPPAALSVAVPALPAAGADPGAALRELGGALASLAAQLRRADPRAPAAYRVLRTALWLPFSEAPRSTAGKSPVPAPPSALRQQLERLLANGKWPELLEEAESALVQHRLWLDLHRFSAQALAALGADHAPARAALIGELAGFLTRLPAVGELGFADGSPVADPQTRAWLDAEVRPAPAASAAGPGAAAPVAGSTAAADDAAEAEAEARALLAQGKLHEAIAGLHARVQAAPIGMPRFGLRLALARALSEAGQLEVARAVHLALDDELRRHDLERWDVALAARCVASHLQCVRALAKAGRAPGHEAAALYDRLCQLDPVLGLKSAV